MAQISITHFLFEEDDGINFMVLCMEDGDLDFTKKVDLGYCKAVICPFCGSSFHIEDEKEAGVPA